MKKGKGALVQTSLAGFPRTHHRLPQPPGAVSEQRSPGHARLVPQWQ